MGKSDVCGTGIETERYKLNKTTVCVSKGEYSLALSKILEPSKQALLISFSTRSGKDIPQYEIEYALKRLGLDVTKHFYAFQRPITEFKYDKTKDPISDILYFEQIVDAESMVLPDKEYSL